MHHSVDSRYGFVFERTPLHRQYWSLFFGSLLASMHAHAYRPFASTDADVADPRELETELGYFAVEHVGGEDSFIIPQFVFNYGLTSTLEVIGEFEVEKLPSESAEIVDAAVLLKGILRQGVLQDRQGLSFAYEAGALIPSTGTDRFGVEAIGIVSGTFSRFTYHLNFGGGLDRAAGQEFTVWGAILEYPFRPNLRLVGEINGETVKGERPDNSGLLGFIWESPSTGNAFDGGIRWGISSVASDWELTLGWTFSFSIR
jgi:hypothetical protein